MQKIFARRSSTIGDILCEKDKWLSIKENDSSAQFKKKHPPKWPQLEEVMTVGSIVSFSEIKTLIVQPFWIKQSGKS